MRDLREGRINEFVLNALLQAGAVTWCERHGDVLLHNGDDGAENTARLMAADWLGREGGVDHIMPHEIREAIVSILDGAAKDGCPECARREDS
jgi:hypothetical protein